MMMTSPSMSQGRAHALDAVQMRVHQRLIEEMGQELSEGRVTARQLRPLVRIHLQAVLNEETTPLSQADRERLAEDVANDVLGYGPIQCYLEDGDVSEIMVNGPDRVYIERNG